MFWLSLNLLHNLLQVHVLKDPTLWVLNTRMGPSLWLQGSEGVSLGVVGVLAGSEVGVGDGSSDGPAAFTLESALAGTLVIGPVQRLWRRTFRNERSVDKAVCKRLSVEITF